MLGTFGKAEGDLSRIFLLIDSWLIATYCIACHPHWVLCKGGDLESCLCELKRKWRHSYLCVIYREHNLAWRLCGLHSGGVKYPRHIYIPPNMGWIPHATCIPPKILGNVWIKQKHTNAHTHTNTNKTNQNQNQTHLKYDKNSKKKKKVFFCTVCSGLPFMSSGITHSLYLLWWQNILL